MKLMNSLPASVGWRVKCKYVWIPKVLANILALVLDLNKARLDLTGGTTAFNEFIETLLYLPFRFFSL